MARIYGESSSETRYEKGANAEKYQPQLTLIKVKGNILDKPRKDRSGAKTP